MLVFVICGFIKNFLPNYYFIFQIYHVKSFNTMLVSSLYFNFSARYSWNALKIQYYNRTSERSSYLFSLIKNDMLSVKVCFHFNNAAKFTKQEKIIISSWNEMKKNSCLSKIFSIKTLRYYQFVSFFPIWKKNVCLSLIID